MSDGSAGRADQGTVRKADVLSPAYVYDTQGQNKNRFLTKVVFIINLAVVFEHVPTGLGGFFSQRNMFFFLLLHKIRSERGKMCIFVLKKVFVVRLIL